MKMKKILLFILMMPIFSLAVFAQPKTVTDFYLAMPNDVYSTTAEGKKITNKAELEKFRRSLIKIKDTKNSYLRIEGAWEGWAEIALLKRSNGGYVIAQAESGCGPACEGFVKFWDYKNGKWTEITKQIWTEVSIKDAAKAFDSRKPESAESADENGFSFYYLLPRYGKTLKVACNVCMEDDGDFVFMQFDWNGTKFVRKLNWK